jgi:hypothetical protein
MARNGSDTRGSFKYGQVYIYGWLGMALAHVALSIVRYGQVYIYG